ncbi:DNA/RNA non-specific endonuclease [Oceanobacillus kimchii]
MTLFEENNAKYCFRFHLIANIFKGSGDLDNLVPMNAALNRREYKN